MHRPLLRQPSAVTVDFDADPLLESLGSTDAVHAVMGELGVVAMCRLACVSRQWRDLVTSDDVAWRELARGIGLSEPPPGLTWRLAVREAWSILVGDALVVVDTYDIPSVARVMAKVDDPALGPLLLLHYEGWSEQWFMWVHRLHDRDRIRPLSNSCPGVGSRGQYTAAMFAEKVEHAHSVLMQGTSTWPVTAGRRAGRWPWPYTQGRSRSAPQPFTVRIEDPERWRASQLYRPFSTCTELAQDPRDCARVHAAATLRGDPDADAAYQAGLVAESLAAAAAAEGRPEQPAAHGGDGEAGSGDEEEEEDEEDDGEEESAHQPPPAAGAGGAAAPNWSVGQRIEACDYVGEWYTARVADVAVENGQRRVLCHFEGWSDRWDEWHAASAPTLRPYMGLERYGAAGSELHAPRWTGALAGGHGAPGGGGAPHEPRAPAAALLSLAVGGAAGADGGASWRLPFAVQVPPSSPPPTSLSVREAAADADVYARLVRVHELLERLVAVSPMLQQLVRRALPVPGAAWRVLLRPALRLLLGVVEALLQWMLSGA